MKKILPNFFTQRRKGAKESSNILGVLASSREYFWINSLIFACVILLISCSFDYDSAPNTDDQPNLIMEKVEYVRISGGNPEVRVLAEEVRRYEAKHTMEMDLFSFEQFNAAPERHTEIPGIDASGSAGWVRMETDTNNFIMRENVEINVKSEDINIATSELSWNDKERSLAAPGTVNVTRSDGTYIKGTGFSADARRRSWEFEFAVEGTVVEAENEE